MRLGLAASVIGLGLVAQLGLAASADAGGLPVAKGVPGTVAADPEGLTTPPGPDRYLRLSTPRGTMIARVERDGGALLRARSFKGELSIPAVAYDGSPGGLSADGRTLILLPSQPAGAKTRFVVLDAKQLQVRDRITLPGRFSFDAISSDGSRMFFIEYLSRFDLTRYAVREYDLSSGRLLPDPVVDPDEPPGDMQGTAVARVNSPDGRWAYTLYDGDEYPFIHALDTAEGRAVCIDLDSIAGYRGPRSLELTSDPDGSELSLVDRKRGPRAVLDTQTFEVSLPSEQAGGGGFPWVAVAMIPVALVAAWALALVVRRRRHGVAPGDAR